MASDEPFVIAGGGVGGLTAALALARAGQSCLLLERAAEFGEVGAGLQLSPNACRALQRLGALDALRKTSIQPRRAILRRADGAILTKISFADAEQRWGAPYLAVHRADLIAALADCARQNPRIAIATAATLTGFIEDEKGVAVTYRQAGEQRRAAGAALIGADGLRSFTRSRLVDQEADKPAYTGHTAWRALIPADALPEALREKAAQIWFGPRAHLVHYPLRDGATVNVVALVEDAWRGDESTEFWDNQSDQRFLRNRFKAWGPLAQQIIGASPSWLRWPLFDRPPLDHFARQRVALLGDAAHPMLPYLAQGAASAIEDAEALGVAAATYPQQAEVALKLYSDSRVARAARIQAASRAQGKIYHLAGAKAFARDLALRLAPPRLLGARQDWIYQQDTAAHTALSAAGKSV